MIRKRTFLSFLMMLSMTIGHCPKAHTGENHKPAEVEYLFRQMLTIDIMEPASSSEQIDDVAEQSTHKILPGKNDSISKVVSLESGIFNETRTIYISLPEGYSGSEKDYPVLYVLPYQKPNFLTDVRDLRSVQKDGQVPEMIIVGISDVDGMTDLTPTKTSTYGPNSGGADKFIEHIRKEVFPYINENYRTSDCRVVKGHSIVGLFLLYTLLSEPNMFDAYALSSPYFPYDGKEEFILKNTPTFLDKRNQSENFIYLTVGSEPKLINHIESFLEILKTKSVNGLNWEYEIKEEHSHHTIKDIVLTEGLKSIYSGKYNVCGN